MRTGGIVLDSEGKGAKRIHLACLFLNFHKAKRTRLTSRAYDCGIYPCAFTIWWKSLDSTTRGMLESWGALWMAAKYIKCTLMRNTYQIRKAICLHESIMGCRDKCIQDRYAPQMTCDLAHFSLARNARNMR